jgi:hypothetical protein
MVVCLRHAIRIERPSPHGPGGLSSSFETLNKTAEGIEDDGNDEEKCVYGRVGARGVQTLDDTRKQNASRAYRQQHKQIVPSATAHKVHKYRDISLI